MIQLLFDMYIVYVYATHGTFSPYKRDQLLFDMQRFMRGWGGASVTPLYFGINCRSEPFSDVNGICNPPCTYRNAVRASNFVCALFRSPTMVSISLVSNNVIGIVHNH